MGLHRPRAAGRGQRRRGRPDRGDRRGRRVAAGRAEVVAERAVPARERRAASSWPTLGITPAQVAEVQQLVDAGTINDKLARQVFEGVLAGEGTPAEVVRARGLAVVSDDSAPRRGRRRGDRRPTRTWPTRSGPARCRPPAR